MGFTRQEYCGGLPCPSPGELPVPGIKPGSPAPQADSSPSEPRGLCCLGLPYVYSIPGDTCGKETTRQYRRHKRRRFDPRVKKIPRRRKWQPSPAFLPGESHGQWAWRATVSSVTESRTRLMHLSTQMCSHRWQESLLPGPLLRPE